MIDYDAGTLLSRPKEKSIISRRVSRDEPRQRRRANMHVQSTDRSFFFPSEIPRCEMNRRRREIAWPAPSCSFLLEDIRQQCGDEDTDGTWAMIRVT